MNKSEELALAEVAEAEVGAALAACRRAGSHESARESLWQVIERWVADPLFAEGYNQLQVAVLNELQFATGEPDLEDAAWEIIRKLAAKWEEEGALNLKEMLRIATFELAAEAPEQAPSLVRLFSLAQDSLTRWAVFAAYENVPWRLRAHARKYSGGSVTDRDCDEWLVSQDLGDDEILMQRM
jgi:hypothetical protein